MEVCIARDGGCAILWKLASKTAVRKLKCNHVRLYGIIIIQISNKCEIVCLNVYMSCGGRSEDDKFAEYMDVLGEIQQLIHSYNLARVI